MLNFNENKKRIKELNIELQTIQREIKSTVNKNYMYN